MRVCSYAMRPGPLALGVYVSFVPPASGSSGTLQRSKARVVSKQAHMYGKVPGERLKRHLGPPLATPQTYAGGPA